MSCIGRLHALRADDPHSFVENNVLYIVPTLTSDQLTMDQITGNTNFTLDLIKDGTCSNKVKKDCVVKTNKATQTIVNPVRSARLRTSVNIKYGKVEVVARMPTGDWIWPAIWMYPKDNVYGDWPAR